MGLTTERQEYGVAGLGLRAREELEVRMGNGSELRPKACCSRLCNVCAKNPRAALPLIGTSQSSYTNLCPHCRKWQVGTDRSRSPDLGSQMSRQTDVWGHINVDHFNTALVFF